MTAGDLELPRSLAVEVSREGAFASGREFSGFLAVHRNGLCSIHLGWVGPTVFIAG